MTSHNIVVQMTDSLPSTSAPKAGRRAFASTLLGLAGLPVLAKTSPAQEAAPMPDDTPVKDGLLKCAPGPWGRVSYYHFYLEAPDYVVAQFPLPGTLTKWIFNSDEAASIGPMLRTAGMPAEAVERMTDPRRVVRNSHHAHVFPSHADLETLTPETRSSVYRLLALNSANVFHYSPVFFLADSVDEWARGSDIPDHIVASIKALSYRSGDALVFSDVPLLLSQAGTVEEARFIMQKLTRVRTLMPRLELSDDDSLSDLLAYWTTGLGLRRRDIEPLLRAIVQTEGVSHLDLVHLLPPLSRKLLYTYPDISHAMEGRLPDCHWTSLNFFKFTPESYLLDSKMATSTVKEDFELVDGPYRYGDILMFVRPNGQAIHSANYLADDITFSKNGSNMLAPWLLMRLGDLGKLYGVRPGGTRVEAFRHKKAAT